MFHTVADFINTWQEEAKSTERVLAALTNETLDKKLHPDVRTIRQLAWHIIETPHEMLGRTGLKITGSEDKEKGSVSVDALVDAHRRVNNSVVHQVQTHWNNKTLHQTDNMYGMTWTRSQTLAVLLSHLIHHRGQLTILMRLAGLKVPGVYGPAKEEWVEFGLAPPQE